jgi:hypothetical protein
MLLFLNSERELPTNSKIYLPENIILFQEFATAREHIENENSETYKIITDIKIHDPIVYEQSKYIYKPMKNGKFPHHASEDGISQAEFYKRIKDIKQSRNVFLTLSVLKQIKEFGFDAVFTFYNYQREVIILNKCIGHVIGKTTDETL